MKQYNLYIAFILGIFLFMIACSEEDMVKKSQIEEGIPVTASLKFAPEESAKIQTRSLTEEQQKQVNDLYVLVFDDKYNIKNRKYFTKENLGGTTSGIIQLETTSGQSYIYGVANVKVNQLEDLESKLDKVTTVAELNKLTARLNSPAEDRNSANLLMCGVYVSEGISEDEQKKGYCSISETGEPSKGEIMLRRLDSHITFKIELGKKISRFVPKSWQVFNMPYVSNVTEQSIEALKQEKDYFNSNKFVQFDKNSFNFYMLENLKESLENEKGEVAQSYKDRELQKKLPGESFDKKGQTCTNGDFVFADKFATYVEIKGALEIEETNGAVTTADVTYTIHLGYVDGPADFKSKRNTKYTYTVTINGVDDIILEVTSRTENAPGAEGEVIEASKTIFNLDAHYHTFLIALEKEKVGKSLNYQVVTPFATVSSTNISTASIKDIDWVKFKRNSYNESGYKKELEKFPLKANQESQLITVDKLSEDIQKAETESGFVYYTVFVNEYYYKEPPTGAHWEKPYWKNFINQSDRKMMLIYEPQYSPDGESSYAAAEYLIKQQSIQSYYSTKTFNENMTAIGIEHYNENGILKWGTSTKGNSLNNGKDNMWEQLDNKNWATYLKTTPSNGKVYNYDFETKYKKAYAACLQRNRDENGDGKISKDELKWYLPSRDQLVNVYIGAESLQDPIYDYTKHNNGSHVHFFTNSVSGENVWKIWAEEGASTGPESKDVSRDFRCIRNLGMDGENTEVAKPFYSYGDYEFILTGMDELSLRSDYISRAEIAPHHNFDRNNLPYKKFRVAKDVVKDKGRIKYVSESDGWWTLNGVDKLSNADNGNSFCSSYKESGYPAGTWRVPNQRELLLMYMEELHKDVNVTNAALYSRTAWKWSSVRHFGTHNSGGAGVFYLSGESPYVPTAVRCVQDIQ